MNLTRSEQLRLQLLRKFHALLRELKIEKQKESILEGYGVDSARDLSIESLRDAVSRLEQFKEGANADVRRLRSVILTILQKLGIYQDNSSWPRVNEYLLQPKIAGKLLYKMSEEELVALRIKLNSILTKQEKKVSEERYLSKNN
jgi:hypothetical protein